ncbi:MAG TPA: trypsin-like serine protease [Polyangia bacterium]|nr:trypsin-like serine protease [Polyangia bacterium]
MRRLALVALVAGCGAAEPGVARAPITNGAADPGDPAVVALLDASGSVACSGTLIAPHTVITAAHCMLDGNDFDQFQVAFGASASPMGALALTDARPHPMFDPATFAHDLCLLTLRQVAPVAPMAIDPRAVDQSFVGVSFSAVGFGSTAPQALDTGTRRSGTAKVIAVDAGGFTVAPAPSQPCAGDSGGAALFQNGGATVLTGVISHGDTGCSDHAVFSRLDVAEASFIQPYLDSIAGGSAQTGERCYFDEQCRAGPCLQALDEPKRFYCAQPCKQDRDCPPAMTCAADGCRYRAPSPGALGATCAGDADCVSGACWLAPGHAGACTRSCIPTGQDCPAGYACTNTGGIAFDCLRAPSSGCALGGSPAPPGGLAFFALALAWLVARRLRAVISWNDAYTNRPRAPRPRLR